jgi:hypothetical protein
LSLRFIGFFICSVLLTSAYITIDADVFLAKNPYDVLLQSFLFLCDYLILSIFLFFLPVLNKPANIGETKLLFACSFIFVFAGSLDLQFLFPNDRSYDYILDMSLVFGECLQVIGYIYWAIQKSPKYGKILFITTATLPTIWIKVDPSNLSDINLILTFTQFLIGLYISKKLDKKITRIMLFGIIMASFSEAYYSINFDQFIPFLNFFMIRIMSALGELAIIYVFAESALRVSSHNSSLKH